MRSKNPNISLFSAEEIMSIAPDRPEFLFTGTKDAASKEYRQLALKWHPDRSADPRSSEVFARLAELYHRALEKLEAGEWHVPGMIELAGNDGRRYRFRYRKHHQFELGDFFVADSYLLYLFSPEFNDLLENGVQVIRSFSFASDAMREEVSRYLPHVEKQFKAADGRVGVLIRKSPDLLLLRDVLDHFGGSVDPRHAAWILSTLHNLACYLQYAGLTHNDISPDTYFISPRDHMGALLGGWWYARKNGDKLFGFNARTYDIAPPDVVADQRADPRVDLELIKATGRELLGNLSGTRLFRESPAPKAMISWLNLPSAGSAIDDYAVWKNSVLKESFGERRFVRLDMEAADLYP